MTHSYFIPQSVNPCLCVGGVSVYGGVCVGVHDCVMLTSCFLHICFFPPNLSHQHAFLAKLSQLDTIKWCKKWTICPGGGGGALAFEVGYHRKKIHVIRVVFQDKAMYVRTSFRGVKTCKIGKKGVFLVILTNFGKDMTDKLKKNTYKNTYLGFIFIPEKYVFRVCFESPFMRMISNFKYNWPPPPGPFAHGLNTELFILG